ncbi:unnamed protein product [Anisakis simplex]|uniref:Protein kinase domain-containing protein n=1 Tax=Anisakis simplex TaxID=6269 RepID=A0A0M3J9G7_ANISI|nr:unnamed protein product [Anisakis simplex]
MSSDKVIRLRRGELIGKKWKVLEKLGEGGCGYVYKVQNMKTGVKVLDIACDKYCVNVLIQAHQLALSFQAALKVESNFVVGGSVLKLEVQVCF